MSGSATLIALTSVAILVVLLARAIYVTRKEARDGNPRGVDPGDGDTIIDASYISGGPGGGHHAQIRVPRDPQAYARSFVPGGKKGHKND